jgi:hypothetical protein
MNRRSSGCDATALDELAMHEEVYPSGPAGVRGVGDDPREWRCHLHQRRLATIVFTLAGVGLGSLPQLGCGDDSKTTGTQVQLSEKDKAEIEGMRAAMKGQRAARKQERKQGR